MTELSKVEALASRLEEKDRLAIAGLIDLKTDEDRDKVLGKLDTIESKFDAKFDAFASKFDALESKFDAKFDTLESKFDAKFEAVDAKFDALDSKFDTLESRLGDFKWFVGVGFAFLGALVTALRLI